MKPTLLVLAAGMGSRYGSLKQIDPVGPSGETILEYSVYDAIRAGFGKIVFVIRKDIEADFKEVFIDKLQNHIEIDYVFQELNMLPEGFSLPEGRVKPWGTAHAILVAAQKIKEPFAVINADDYYGADAYKKMADFLVNCKNTDTTFSMVGFEIDKTLSDHGSVSRGICEVNKDAELVKVVERTQIASDEKGIAFVDNNQKTYIAGNTTVSMNFWGFTPVIFEKLNIEFKKFLTESISNLKSEIYIPNVVDNFIKTNQSTVKVLVSKDQWFGVTYKEDRPLVVAKLKELTDKNIYPKPLWK